MAAGLFGYIGYDMVRLMERLPAVNADPLGLPDAILVRPTIMAIFDSVKDEVTVVTPVYPSPDVSAKAAYARASERLYDVIDAFDRPLDLLAHAAPDAPPIGEPRSNTSPRTTRPWSPAPRTTSPPATSSRWCCRSASRPSSPCRRSRSTGRCAGSIRRRSCIYLDFDASRSSARARKSWCGCATAR
jgi:hypothetical protein